MVAASGREADDSIGIMPPGRGVATVHAIAVNAVMAGCGPEHMRTVLAAIGTVLDEEFNLGGIQATTSPVTPALMINGPIVGELGFNAGHDCFGPGTLANAVVGPRHATVPAQHRLRQPGGTDMSTQGQPGKYSFCFAENEEASPWESHAVERGFKATANTVTAFQAAMIMNILDFGSKTAESLVVTLARAMATTNTNSIQIAGGDLALILCPDHAEILGRDGWSKDDVKQFIFQNARLPFSAFSPGIQSCMPRLASRHVQVHHRLDDAADRERLAAHPDRRRRRFRVPIGFHSRVRRRLFDHSRDHINQRNTMRGNTTAVDEAFAGIREGLQADGYDLEVVEASGTVLKVTIVALEGACEDCLSPPSVMSMILSGSLEGAYSPEELEITYPSSVHF